MGAVVKVRLWSPETFNRFLSEVDFLWQFDIELELTRSPARERVF